MQQSTRVLAPTLLFNCLPQVALTRELEMEKEENKTSYGLGKHGRLVHILDSLTQLSQGLSEAIMIY